MWFTGISFNIYPDTTHTYMQTRAYDKYAKHAWGTALCGLIKYFISCAD